MPASVKVPAPALVRANAPPTTPPKESVFAVVVIVRAAVKVIAPVVCVRLAVPVKSRLAPSESAFVTVRAEAASSEPPVTDNVLVPRAAALPIRKVPALRMVVPE